MQNIISFPKHSRSHQREPEIRLIYCRNCLRYNVPDLSLIHSRSFEMIVPIVNQDDEPLHAHVTIDIMNLKGILAANDTDPYVDLAEYGPVRILPDTPHPEQGLSS